MSTDKGTSRRYPKPKCAWVRSPKQASRNGSRIDSIILHYTAGGTLQGAVDTLTIGDREASAHYVIGRAGECVQLVEDSQKAWHCRKNNTRSIGIEHVAKPGQALTAIQERVSVELIKYLMTEYHIPKEAITGHKFTGQPTDCPGNLFGPEGTLAELQAWIHKHFSDVVL